MKELKEISAISKGIASDHTKLNELEKIMLVLYLGVEMGMELEDELNIMKGQYLLALEEEKENK